MSPEEVRERFSGPNLGYLLERFEIYEQDPGRLEPDERMWMERNAPALRAVLQDGMATPTARVDEFGGAAVAEAIQAVQRLRRHGHLAARFDEAQATRGAPPTLSAAAAGVSVDAVNRGLEVPIRGTGTLGDVWPQLQACYADRVGYEFEHLDDAEERAWLSEAVESARYATPLSPLEQRILLRRLIQVEEFERFLHTTFPGQKRFSIEGTDMLVPMLDESIRLAAQAGAEDVVIGMAHRGRLNVLAHVLGKPYDVIMQEFHAAPSHDGGLSEASAPLSAGWTGDVKYHLGLRSILTQNGGPHPTVRVTLANNASHLEFVNPVVEGMARAAQDGVDQPGAPPWHQDQALPILVHGDAAFPGEGVAAETMNLARLPGYTTGGTLHIIANNDIGFTTEPEEGRSTRYASDLAKGFDVPVVHVSADQPEDCIMAVRLAHAWRQRFHRDFLIDLVGYRRWGHNEGDDPAFTQPVLYRWIAKHPTVRRLWADRVVAAGAATAEEERAMAEEVRAQLRAAYDAARTAPPEPGPGGPPDPLPSPAPTGVDEARLRRWHRELLTVPDGFHVYPKLERVLERWRQAIDKPDGIDWALAEMLAWASILADGVPVRVSGQDTERGTFSQRHGVWHDAENGATYRPLQHLSDARAAFQLYNSPLSEAGVMGFEYGYSVQRPEALVCWEAQFGDFANAAQVYIDQFLAAAHAKWRQDAGLVLLLPHGYEGQGAEHSSARLERFLELSAEFNWRVAYPTTAAQYFHLLRSQVVFGRQHPMPLVVMTPKSLLRHPRAGSNLSDLAQGQFQPVLVKHRPPGPVERFVLLTGKLSVDILAELDRRPEEPVMVVAIEQLYPLPAEAIQSLLAGLPDQVTVVWAQEEPANMGAWRYIRPWLEAWAPGGRVQYAGRPDRSSPAEGMPDMHTVEQARIVREALGLGEPAVVAGAAKGAKHGR
jgi:2-oxoglutarate dehydrogenase E1 component